MKKSSLVSLVSYLNGETVDNIAEIKAEIEAELAKGKAKADANRALYAELHDAVILTLANASAPVTAQEIADEIGEPRGKIVYGLTHYWVDEVVKDATGKTTTYTLAR